MPHQDRHPDKNVHHYLDVGLIHVLSRQKDRRYVEVYLQQTLGKLVEYDLQKNGHFRKAVFQLTEFIEKPDLNKFEKQGLIQCFEYTFELAWKTAKDYSQSS